MFILHIILNPDPGPNAHPNPEPRPTPTPLNLTRIEYLDRAGGVRIIEETLTTNEVHTARNGLKMSCVHPFGHHN